MIQMTETGLVVFNLRGHFTVYKTGLVTFVYYECGVLVQVFYGRLLCRLKTVNVAGLL